MAKAAMTGADTMASAVPTTTSSSRLPGAIGDAAGDFGRSVTSSSLPGADTTPSPGPYQGHRGQDHDGRCDQPRSVPPPPSPRAGGRHRLIPLPIHRRVRGTLRWRVVLGPPDVAAVVGVVGIRRTGTNLGLHATTPPQPIDLYTAAGRGRGTSPLVPQAVVAPPWTNHTPLDGRNTAISRSPSPS